jgi:hypothetical protein
MDRDKDRGVGMPEGMREADGNLGFQAEVDRLVAAIDKCRACPSRAGGRICQDCALEKLS